jgi:hypothetical protein
MSLRTAGQGLDMLVVTASPARAAWPTNADGPLGDRTLRRPVTALSRVAEIIADATRCKVPFPQQMAQAK